MSRERSHPAELISAGDVGRPAGWCLNGVPLNAKSGLLAIVLLAGVMLVASVGYRLLAEGTTDMTLPAVSSPSTVPDGEDIAPPESG